MDQQKILNLIKDGVVPGTWADLGSGTGAFTLALRELAGPDVEIYSVDQNADVLARQRQQFQKLYHETIINYIADDFQNVALPPLDGILMANSLHFIKYKESFIDKIKSALKPGGRLLIVEYDTDKGNVYVPHPLSYGKLERILKEKGFHVRLLGTALSQYQNSMYSALGTLL
jgi:ubiquinone/menaquinone biosynthesis C-methylase UbiE